MAVTYFDSPKFMDALVALLVQDREALQLCSSIVTSKDFRPKGQSSSSISYARWVTSQAALEHWEKYREPIGYLLPAELQQRCHTANINGNRLSEILTYGKKCSKRKILAPTSITDKVVQFKKETLKANAVQEIISLQEKGQLTDDKWLEVSREAIKVFGEEAYRSSDYFAELEDRIDRRRFQKEDRFPLLLIPEFDYFVRAIAKGHFGLVLAPYKRGKSLMLIHIAGAYVLQRLNVLFITLEDPGQDVEDRFDSFITHLPIKNLSKMPKTLRKRFANFKRMARARLKIVDGTDKTVSVHTIEGWIEEERNRGFHVDAVIVDYDDEIAPLKKQTDRRLELAEIYRDLRKLASKQRIVWTAAQTQRNTVGLKILSGDRLAEDVSKVRKVSLALALGQGDWGDDSIYLHVAAHKFDRQYFGCNILSDKDRMLIYSRERTARAKKHPEKYIPKDDEEDK